MTVDTLPMANPEIDGRLEAAEVHRVAEERLRNIDEALAELMARRMQLAGQMGWAKRSTGVPVYNGAREQEVIDRFIMYAMAGDIPPSKSRPTIIAIVGESRFAQGDQGISALQPLDPDTAQEMIEQVREEYDTIDPAIAYLLGERLATAAILKEARMVAGIMDDDRGGHNALDNFVELAEAGGLRRQTAITIMTPYLLER